MVWHSRTQQAENFIPPGTMTLPGTWKGEKQRYVSRESTVTRRYSTRLSTEWNFDPQFENASRGFMLHCDLPPLDAQPFESDSSDRFVNVLRQ